MDFNAKTNPGRESRLQQLEEDKVWDVLIIGGGATGAGIAVDAAARGFSTVLFDTQDFSEGTSSRSTKLIHGGVRYMKNPRDWKLVREAMIEVGKTEFLSAAETIRRLPGVKADGLKGGVQFWDAQFDDSRLNIALMKTAEARGALLLNYVPVVGFERGCGGEITVVKVKDKFSGKEYSVKTRMVFNAAGVWADEIRRMVSPDVKPFIRASRGSHIVVSTDHFGGKTGMFIPKTSDGRVLFCIPWHGVLEIGTTDKEEKDISFNPEPTEEEIEFMLETARKYLAYPISRKDVLASFAGLRPLFNPNAGGSTAAVSREHSVIPEFKNMITVTGGKWTAYRKMAEHAMSVAVDQGLIYKRPCPTKYMSIYRDNEFNPDEIEAEILKGTLTDEQLKAYAVHCRDTQFAMTPEDVLYRRLRIGQMNKAKTEELLPKIKDVFEAEASE